MAGKLHHLKPPRVQPLPYKTALGQKEGIVYRQMPIRNVIFCGHVDAGKSTTTGALLKVTGLVADQTIEKFRKEATTKNKGSFALAWVTDTAKAERDTGKTMDLCHVELFTGNQYYTIIDSPGHTDYIRNMITGSAQADVMALILDAEALYSNIAEWKKNYNSEECEPLKQWSTQQHAVICRGLGVTDGVVILNKMDMIPQNIRADAFNEMKAYLKAKMQACGFAIRDQDFCPIAAYLELGLSEPFSGIPGARSLIETLDSIPERDSKDTPFRLHIEAIYKEVQGTNVVFTGKVQSGIVRPGDELKILPCNDPVTVRTIQMHRKPLTEAPKGCNVGIDVKGPSGKLDELKKHYGRNSILCGSKSPVSVSNTFRANAVLIDMLADKGLMVDRTKVILHMASGVSSAACLRAIENPFSLTQKAPISQGNVDAIMANTRATLTFETDSVLPLETRADHPRNGSFLIREGDKTLGWGYITQILPTSTPGVSS